MRLSKNILNIYLGIMSFAVMLVLVGCTLGEAVTPEEKDTISDSDSDSESDSSSDSDSDFDNENDTVTINYEDVVCEPSGDWSQSPPCDLDVSEVPMFVAIGFDDNTSEEAMRWAMKIADARKNPDGSDVRFSFYVNTEYSSTAGTAWTDAYAAGHEIGNHTDTHPHGVTAFDENWNSIWEILMDETEWTDEIQTCHEGIAALNPTGFRTPFLEYTNHTFTALAGIGGYEYDCSIEEGFQSGQDGTNFVWPYDLKDGSPGDSLLADWNSDRTTIGQFPGLWEMPVHPVIVPPDDLCSQYGVDSGLRGKMKDVNSWWESSMESGKITGLDWNLFANEGGFQQNKAQFLATLKYTYDLRKQGNRAPFLFGAHSQFYVDTWKSSPNMSVQERQEALEEFLDYVLEDEFARIVPIQSVLNWCKYPTKL